jgi:hypothetical protein
MAEAVDGESLGGSQTVVSCHRSDEHLVKKDGDFDPRHGTAGRSDEGEVEPSVAEGLDEDVGACFGQGDADVGIAIVELGQQLAENRDRTSAHHADGDVAVDEAGELVDGEASALDGIEGSAGKREHGRSDSSEPDRSARAVEEGIAELALELANLSAHTRLADVDTSSGAGEVRLFGYGHEVLQLSQFHTCGF